jgi:DNA-binding NtrC family response regulator
MVDDERILVEVLSSGIAQQCNVEVRAAYSAMEARFLLENEKFDCIITDYNLGALSAGDRLIEFIRRCPLNKTTKIIMMSGCIDQATIDKHRQSISRFLAKPVDYDSLIEEINRHVG